MVFNFWTVVLDFDNNIFNVLDQKLLPFKEIYINLKNKEDVYKVIKGMNVRGAPLIGIVALIGVYLEIINNSVKNFDDLLKLMDYLQNARPTAINVFNYFSELKNILKDKNNYEQVVKNFLINVMLNEKKKMKE